MAKVYNHRRAENEYAKWKQKDEEFMVRNGMSKEKIKIMREFDRKQFNSNRRFEEKIELDSEKIVSVAQQPEVFSLNDVSNLEDFINSIKSLAFVEALEELGFEVQVIVFLLYRGFNGKEISKITGIPEWTISRRLSKLERSYYMKKLIE